MIRLVGFVSNFTERSFQSKAKCTKKTINRQQKIKDKTQKEKIVG